MRTYKDVAEAARQNDGDSVVALGFFDGVHRAHAAVLAAARAEADRRALPLFVLTFRGDDAPQGGAPLLTSDEERLALFAAMGVDSAVLSPFSSLSHLSPEAFVTSVLLGTLSARVAVTGENFRFGYRAAGDAARLSHLMNEGGGEAIALPPVLYGGAPISSTRVRAALADGDCALAEALLGRPYALTLPVVRGEARGVRPRGARSPSRGCTAPASPCRAVPSLTALPTLAQGRPSVAVRCGARRTSLIFRATCTAPP